MSLRAAMIGLALAATPHAQAGEKVPDALAVEWQGRKPCENLFEDSQIRVLRCTFAPGAMHLRHSHPAHLSYVLSGGRRRIVDARGSNDAEARTDSYTNNPATAWHELTNIGDTTIRYLIVERKYEPVAGGSGRD